MEDQQPVTDEHNDRSEDNLKNRKYTALEKSNWFFGVILAINAVWLTCITYNQWQDSKMARRPWVGITTLESGMSQTFSLDRPMLRYPFKNSGGSPALNTSTLHRVRIWNNPPPLLSEWTNNTIPNFDDCFTQAVRNEGIPVWPSSLYFNTSEPLQMSNSDFAAITKGEKTLFDVGCIVYEDEAGDTHHTRFCQYMPAVQDIGVSSSAAISRTLMYCPVGNTAD